MLKMHFLLSQNKSWQCLVSLHKKGNNRERRKPCGKFSTASRKWKMHVTTKMTICRCRYDIKKKDVVTVTTLYLVDHWWATISRVVEMAKRNQKRHWHARNTKIDLRCVATNKKTWRHWSLFEQKWADWHQYQWSILKKALTYLHFCKNDLRCRYEKNEAPFIKLLSLNPRIYTLSSAKLNHTI